MEICNLRKEIKSGVCYVKADVECGSSSEKGLHNRAAAVFNRNDSLSRYGYCIVEFDEDILEARIFLYRLIDAQYVVLPHRIHSIPINDERKNIIEFRKTMMRGIEGQLISKADDLFVAGRRSTDGMTTFQELFIAPVLMDKSFRDYITSSKRGDSYKIEIFYLKTRTILFSEEINAVKRRCYGKYGLKQQVIISS